MNTKELCKCIQSDPIMRRQCAGVFPANQIPQPDGYPFTVIVNLDPYPKPGSHWICLYIDQDGRVEHFDSYGRNPNTKEIKTFLKDYDVHNNTIQVQSSYSSTCGQYCLYYMYHRIRNQTMDSIMHRFTSDLDKNDSMVTMWVNKMFDMRTDVFELDYVLNQIARSMLLK